MNVDSSNDKWNVINGKMGNVMSCIFDCMFRKKRMFTARMLLKTKKKTMKCKERKKQGRYVQSKQLACDVSMDMKTSRMARELTYSNLNNMVLSVIILLYKLHVLLHAIHKEYTRNR